MSFPFPVKNVKIYEYCKQFNITFEEIERLILISDICKQYSYDYTALHVLCRNRSVNMNIFKLMIIHGADLNIKNHVEYNSVYYLSQNRSMNKRLIQYAIYCGSDFDIIYGGNPGSPIRNIIKYYDISYRVAVSFL
jgi:hypothetical protein